MIHIRCGNRKYRRTRAISPDSAATGSPLHLIGRLGFRLDDRDLKRAGLDYWSAVELHRHDTLESFESFFTGRVFCLSAHAKVVYTRLSCQDGDCLLFGSETRGLPPDVLERYADRTFAIPMPTGKVRSSTWPLRSASCFTIACGS